MNKKVKYIPLATILAALLLTSCTQPPAPVSGISSESVSSSSAVESSSSEASQETPENPDRLPESAGIITQMTELYSQLDTTPIPKVENSLWSGYVDMGKATAEHLPPQLLWNDPKAYEIAQQLLATMPFSGVMEHDFDGTDNSYRPDLLAAALVHTAPLDIEWSWDGETREFSMSSYPDHVLAALLQSELSQGRFPSAVFYAGDVDETMTRLFGDVEYSHLDLDTFYYYEREGVYLQLGDRGGPYWLYPQITAHSETGNSITCEIVPVWVLDKEIMAENDVAVTVQNFEAVTAKNAKYRVTFTREEDGRLLMTSYQNLRAAQ